MKAYCTLLTNDRYVDGALVLSHTLKKNGTKYPTAVMYTPDVSEENVARLQKSFDFLHQIVPVSNPNSSALNVMSRADLASTLTKISLWSLTQYTTLLYLDADTLPLRSPDELFNLSVPFAAAPELGFPDCFNSGVMLLQPSLIVFREMLSMAEAGKTYDGGDQGLLNLYFGTTFHRLSFLYNIECSNVYHLYMPALKRERERWSVIHFIGKRKPWDWTGALVDNGDESAYGDLYRELVGMWWSRWEEITGRKKETTLN